MTHPPIEGYAVNTNIKEKIMISKSELRKDIVRPIAIALVSVAFGSLIGLLIEIILDREISKLLISLITFIFAALSAFYLFPKVIKSPFRNVSWSEYMHRLGFYLPPRAWKHALLGVVLAGCTLSGMLLGSLLTGRYELDWDKINISQILFSINPGLWEEYFYRGVIMFVLISATRSVRQSALIQIVLFGLTHIKEFDTWALVDVLSVMILAVAFTYTALKTRTLVAGIVFHFLHDAFLFLPQVPGGEYVGFIENFAFYASLWLMVGVSCVLIKFAVDRLAVRADQELYTLEYIQSGQETT
jgi:membrane protease YdiL (CAAX protease family)